MTPGAKQYLRLHRDRSHQELRPKIQCSDITASQIQEHEVNMKPAPDSPTYTIDSTIISLAPAEYGGISPSTSRAIRDLQRNNDSSLCISSCAFNPLKALFHAIRDGFSATVSFLLSAPYNSDLNQILSPEDDEDDAQLRGKTPLYVAASLGETAIAKILLSHGADPITVREPALSHTAFDIALCKGHTEIVQLMLEDILRQTTEAAKKRDLTASYVAQYSIRYAVLYAASLRNVEVVRMALKGDFPVDTRTNVRGRSALVMAAELGAVDVVRELVEWVPKRRESGEEDKYGDASNDEERKFKDENVGGCVEMGQDEPGLDGMGRIDYMKVEGDDNDDDNAWEDVEEDY